MDLKDLPKEASDAMAKQLNDLLMCVDISKVSRVCNPLDGNEEFLYDGKPLFTLGPVKMDADTNPQTGDTTVKFSRTVFK